MVYHVPDAIRWFGNIKHFSCVKYVVIHPHLYILYVGVEKHNDDCNYFSSNRWDATAEIMMAEHRLELLQKYAREKRQYTKRSAEYWHEGEIEETRSQMREALKY